MRKNPERKGGISNEHLDVNMSFFPVLSVLELAEAPDKWAAPPPISTRDARPPKQDLEGKWLRARFESLSLTTHLQLVKRLDQQP